MLDKKNIPSAYAEVHAFIDALGDDYRNQIPRDVPNHMERKKDPDAHFEFHALNPDINFV